MLTQNKAWPQYIRGAAPAVFGIDWTWRDLYDIERARTETLLAQRERLVNALTDLLAEVRLKGHCPSDGVEPCGLCRAISGAEKALEG